MYPGLCQSDVPMQTRGGSGGTISVEALAVLVRTVLSSSNSGSDGDDVQCLVSKVSGWGKPFFWCDLGNV